MNKTKRTKLIAGAVAATLILGGAGYVQSQQAFAAADNAAAGPSVEAGKSGSPAPFAGRGHRGGMMGGKEGGGLTSSTADLLGITADAVKAQLKEGKTLAQIAEAAGFGKADYLARLVAAETAKIDERLTAGDITAEQAAAGKASLAERLAQAIEADMPAFGGRGPGRGGHGIGRFGGAEAMAEAVGLTEEALKAALEDGRSLAEIAAAQGIGEDALIAKLKDAMEDELRTFVNEKRPAKKRTGDEGGQSAAQTDGTADGTA